MKTCITILSLALLLFCAVAASPRDGFSGVTCGSDIPKALIGRVMPNERVAVTESRHKDLGLKDLGGTEISDRLFCASWRICGNEYMWLQDSHNVVRDVLTFPEHSKRWPEFIGECQNNGKKVSGQIVAILDNEEGKDTLSAKVAWKIDEKGAKFIKVPTDGLRCPRDGIITTDGGR
jgi:hypothetical protein